MNVLSLARSSFSLFNICSNYANDTDNLFVCLRVGDGGGGYGTKCNTTDIYNKTKRHRNIDQPIKYYNSGGLTLTARSSWFLND